MHSTSQNFDPASFVRETSNSRGVYLGDERFKPLFDELERRKAVVFVHPTVSPDPAAHSLGLPDTLIDFTADTTRAVAKLHYSNTFAHTPNVKYILSHAGGTIPYLAHRFAIVDAMKAIHGEEERGTAADTFRRLYYDTAASWSDPVLNMLRSIVSVDHVLYGSDFPYIRRDIAAGSVQAIEQAQVLNDAERRAVLGGTASALIPRLASLRNRQTAGKS